MFPSRSLSSPLLSDRIRAKSDYIPPSHQGIFGTLSDTLDLEGPSSARESPIPASIDYRPSSPSSNPAFTETIGDALRKALAPNKRDGPGFVKAMKRFNDTMADVQADGSLARHLEMMEGKLDREVWSGLVDVVHEQAYSRVVGPYSNELEVCRLVPPKFSQRCSSQHHPKHPEEVARAISAKEDAYGELRHKCGRLSFLVDKS